MSRLRRNIVFAPPQDFSLDHFAAYRDTIGLYFIFTTSLSLAYPFSPSRLIYIGMSEQKTNGIASRLKGHLDGQSNNLGLINYARVTPLQFTCLNFEMLTSSWDHSIEDLESWFLIDFVEKHGVYPICNNRSTRTVSEKPHSVSLEIEWRYFA